MGETKSWYVYMVKCSDGTIYTGISNDVEDRLKNIILVKEGNILLPDDQ